MRLMCEKQMDVDTCVQSLNKDMKECLDKGEASHDMTLFPYQQRSQCRKS